ncbi:hypothetical protein PT974_02423 [Cladobotryum mycophilum]|uniref:Nephrocystin 3-like N-terminal domain-containing protein n=1 Tax=Cladobotryum mycophilum TaxID=491253 RepID=A0ABR0SZB9_9HYPO
MVGIGSGMPPKIRLGDVVVGVPTVQWDLDKAEVGASFNQTGPLNTPPLLLLTALTLLETYHDLSGSKIPEYLDELKEKWPRLAPRYLRSDSLKDVLFRANYNHINSNPPIFADADDEDEADDSCKFCDKTMIMKQKHREMHVHYGLVASGNQVIKGAIFRDRLNEDLGGNVLCVEMGAAGLMNDFPCLIVRGICDYADSHRNKDWQEHAAAVATAFTKELLGNLSAYDVNKERPVKDIIMQVLDTGPKTEANVTRMKAELDSKNGPGVRNRLTPHDYRQQQKDYISRRQPGTGQWFLESREFLGWLTTSKQTLFCPGDPFTGKTILSSIVVEHLESMFHKDLKIGIAYIYCNFQQQHGLNVGDLLVSVLNQLAQYLSPLPSIVTELYERLENEGSRTSCGDIIEVLQQIIALYSRVFIIVDALDEHHDGGPHLIRELFYLQTKHEVNIFATSRFLPRIINMFNISVSMEIRANTSDVETYLTDHIKRLPSVVQRDRRLQTEIIEVILKAFDGSFLLAQVYLELLNDQLTADAIRRTLSTLQDQETDDDRKAQAAQKTYCENASVDNLRKERTYCKMIDKVNSSPFLP